MIDFKNLRFKVDNYYSFVGIKKKENRINFYLPKGFEKYAGNKRSFSEKRDLFFQFYKVINTFKEICAAKGYLEEDSKHRTQDRDGVIKSNSGSGIQDNQQNTENIFYSKLDIIGGLLNAYDEPKILSLAYRLGKSDKFDVSKIHRHLHQAIYLPNNAAYVDQMTLPKKVVQFESTDIVAMYCYLFCEVKQQLQESVSPEIASLAETFRQHYLGSQDSIFDEQTYEQTLNTLKDALETIDRNTPIKDADYWQYYEAIELFLYGDFSESEDGEIWGISNFWSVWESMCLTYLVKDLDIRSILKIDTKYLNLNLIKQYNFAKKLFDLSNIYNINLKPDIVLHCLAISEIEKEYKYKIERVNWDDEGYETTIAGLEIENPEIRSWYHQTYHSRVACKNQDFKHTFNQLEKIYKKTGSKTIIVDKPLPEDFFSFWLMKETIDIDYLRKMYYFNHFYYLALKKGVISWVDFNDKILKPLEANFSKNRSKYSDNVFAKSIFRGLSERQIKENFNNFMQKILVFKIIDIKYLSAEFFSKIENVEKIKRKSVRKQFVYEHQLQKKLIRERKKVGEIV